ncbi:MAG: DNA mismatch repair endonuclease MutL [Oscillospiraceae bacterium]|nr:DNA mismatch repair endonuclease MutL [Oscillospiraceae bacterium]
MPKIVQLEQHVADLIAAGEVVQRPASVVKELMENSIDSGAGIITVEISSGGMAYIRITDNGCGISAVDAKTAFLRHATSKLRNAEGLEAIGTLGFRGEALAAIAAVSRIELLTRESGADEGICLKLEGGEVVDMSPAGCPEGTTIIVRDLFYNTPARFKFMKSDRAEGSSVASIVLKCALSRPDISVRFIKDGKTEYHTPGDSRVESCIYSLLGRDIEAGFLCAESSDEAVSTKGFVSSPAAARGNRSYQFFFVNGRVIRSLLLQTALEGAYKNTLASGRFPSCVLYITTQKNNVDVNVHPTKTEVKFVSEKHVFDSVYYAALGALEKTHIGVEGAFANSQTEFERTFSKARIENDSLKQGGGFKSMQADEFRNSYIAEPAKKYNTLDNPSLKPESKTNYLTRDLKFDILHTENSPPHFQVIGEAFSVYIIVECSDSVRFIDKHAAHERIYFDMLKSADFESMSESLITPVICRLGYEDASVLLENAAFLDKLGFSVESFGEDAVAVRHIPAEIDISDTEFILSEMCLQLRHGGAATPSQLDSIYKAIACKAAIKAGRSSGIRELESLAGRVMSGEVTHCPHGRPVAFELTKSTLEKNLGRI